MKHIWIILLFIGSMATAQQSNKAVKKMSPEERYEQNITKETIDGNYIPKDLEDAIVQLQKLSDGSSLNKFKDAPEAIIASKLHFSLGRWIRIHWNLEEGSRYVAYLKSLGLKDIDHMVQFTIVSFHRHLNNRPQDIKNRVTEYEKEIQARLKKLKERTTTEVIK